jgi:hypothetical protein
MIAVRPILMSEELVQQLARLHSVGDHMVRWEWGEPDEQGFYTPNLYADLNEEAYQDRLDGAALRRLREALPDDADGFGAGAWRRPEDEPGYPGWGFRVDSDWWMEDGLHSLRGRGATIAEAADKCREALG